MSYNGPPWSLPNQPSYSFYTPYVPPYIYSGSMSFMPQRDSWVVEFENRHRSTTSEPAFEWSTKNVKDRLYTIHQIESGRQTGTQQEIDRLYSEFYENGRPDTFSHAFEQFRKAQFKKTRKKRWRKKKRTEYLARKPQIEERNHKAAQEVNVLFAHRTIELKKKFEQKRKSAARKLELQASKKASAHCKKILSCLIPIFHQRLLKANSLSTFLANSSVPSSQIAKVDNKYQKTVGSEKNESDKSNVQSKPNHEANDNSKQLDDQHATLHTQNKPQVSQTQQFYNSGNKDILALVQIRREWDRFIVPYGTSNGTVTRIPRRFPSPPMPPALLWIPSLSFKLKNTSKYNQNNIINT